MKLGFIELIHILKKVHKDKYNWSLINEDMIKDVHSKVPIICVKCKDIFWQAVWSHIRGSGCPICAGKQKKTLEQFILEVENLFGKDYWDLSKVKYVSNKVKAIVGCKTQKHKLVASGWGTPGQTESEILTDKNYHRVYDCGNQIWEWLK